MAKGKVKVTLTGSHCGCTQPQRATLRALGLRKRDDSREHNLTPVIEGMIDKVRHLVEVNPVSE